MSAAWNNLRQYLIPITLTLPPILFVRDNFYSLYRVKGSSMEPALKHGDVVLVRKADFYPRRQWAQWAASPSSNSDSYNQQCGMNHDRENALRAIALDAQSQRPIGDNITGYTFLNPPTIYQLGSVVVFRAPDAEKYPSSEYRVKRVIGLGGQNVGPVDSFHRIVRIPPFGLWVEGDNRQASDYGRVHDYVESSENEKENSFYRTSFQTSSIDSRSYGPVSKNLVIGVAERVVWPPSRCGTIERITPQQPTSWWPDFY